MDANSGLRNLFTEMHSQLLFATLIHLSLEQSFMGSGEGILLLPTCGPPDLPSYELNTTEENYNLLIHEGRCYLICLTDEFSVSCHSLFLYRIPDNIF